MNLIRILQIISLLFLLACNSNNENNYKYVNTGINSIFIDQINDLISIAEKSNKIFPFENLDIPEHINKTNIYKFNETPAQIINDKFIYEYSSIKNDINIFNFSSYMSFIYFSDNGVKYIFFLMDDSKFFYYYKNELLFEEHKKYINKSTNTITSIKNNVKSIKNRVSNGEIVNIITNLDSAQIRKKFNYKFNIDVDRVNKISIRNAKIETTDTVHYADKSIFIQDSILNSNYLINIDFVEKEENNFRQYVYCWLINYSINQIPKKYHNEDNFKYFSKEFISILKKLNDKNYYKPNFEYEIKKIYDKLLVKNPNDKIVKHLLKLIDAIDKALSY